MTRRASHIWLLSLAAWLLGVIAPQPALAQFPGMRGSNPNTKAKAQLLGVLTYTRLTVQFEEVPAREAFNSVAKTLGVTIIGRYSDDKTGEGIDPAIPLTIAAENRPAREVLEEMLEQCEVYEDCTWQLRTGMIEVGTKRRLAVPAARESVTYDLTDLLLEPPYFVGPADMASGFARVESEFVDAVLGEKSRQALRDGVPVPRKTKGDILQELIEGIVETIEPGHWDLGSERDQPQQSDAEAGANAPSPPPARGGHGASTMLPPKNNRLWATLRVFREGLIIAAPDFMHREIGGYPRPIKPADADTVRVVEMPSKAAPKVENPAAQPAGGQPAARPAPRPASPSPGG